MSDKKNTDWSADKWKECGRLRSRIGQSLGLGGGHHNWSCDKCKQKKKKNKKKKKKESEESVGRGGAVAPRNKETTPIKLFMDNFRGGGWVSSKRRGSKYQEVTTGEKEKESEESVGRGGAVAPRNKEMTPIKLFMDNFPGGGWVSSKCRGSNYQEVTTGEKERESEESVGRGGAVAPRNKETTPIKLLMDNFPGGGWVSRKRRGSNYQEVTTGEKVKEHEEDEQDGPNFSPVSSTEQDPYSASSSSYSAAHQLDLNEPPPLHVTGHRKKTEQESHYLVSRTEQYSAYAPSCFAAAAHQFEDGPKFSPVSSTEQDPYSASSSSYSAAHQLDLNEPPPLHVTGHRKKTEQESHSSVSRTEQYLCKDQLGACKDVIGSLPFIN